MSSPRTISRILFHAVGGSGLGHLSRQIALARAWSESLGAYTLTAGQVLVTLGDTEERRRYLKARSTIAKLLEWRSVPVINENDTVATAEIKFGDNDRLDARVASMMGADRLVLLSDVDGLYTANPGQDAGAAHIPEVTAITPEIEQLMTTGSSNELIPASPRGVWRAWSRVCSSPCAAP